MTGASAPATTPAAVGRFDARAAALRLAAAAALVGLAVSLELVRHHVELGNPEFHSICSVSARVDCSTVLRTRYAKAFGVPIAAWGTVAYFALAAAAVAALRRRDIADRVAAGIAAAGLGSVGFSAWLFYVSHWRLHLTCLLCHALYLVAVAVAGAGIWAVRAGPRGLLEIAREEWGRIRAEPQRSAGAFAALLLAAAAVPHLESARRDRFVRTSIYGDVIRGTWPRIDPALLPLEGFPSTGPADAPVVVVEFADFECLFCAESRFILEDLLRSHPVRLVFVPYPAGPCTGPDARRWACLAAAGAVAASRDGDFWRYHEAAFSDPARFRSPAGRREIEAEAGLPPSTLDRILADFGTDTWPWNEVARNVETARTAGVVHGTPSFFVNGMGFQGYQEAWFWDLLVRNEIDRARNPAP